MDSWARACFEAPGRADALDIGHDQLVTRGVVRDRAGEPAHGDQAQEFRLAGLEVDHGNGVLGAVGDVEGVAGGIERQRIGAGPEQVGGTGLDPDGLHHLVRARVDHAERVAAGVGHHDVASIRRGGEGGRVQADHDLADGRFLVQADHGNRAFIGDVAHRVHAHLRAPGPPAR